MTYGYNARTHSVLDDAAAVRDMETFLAQTAVTVATKATSKAVDLAVTSNNSETIKRSIATQAKRQVSFANAQHQRQQASVNDHKRAANTHTAT